jgi:hypothetical protein
MTPLDATARRWQAWSERTGRPLVFSGSDCSFLGAADYPDDPDDAKPVTADHLVDMIERGEIDDERALELADSLCEPTRLGDELPQVAAADTDALDRLGEQVADQLLTGGRAYDDDALELADQLSYAPRR